MTKQAGRVAKFVEEKEYDYHVQTHDALYIATSKEGLFEIVNQCFFHGIARPESRIIISRKRRA